MKSHRSALLGLVLGASVLTAAACESKTEVIVPPDPVSVTVSPTAITLEVGQTQQLVAQVGGGDAGTPRTVTWASSNTAVATVDQNGVVRGVAIGVATVTATSTADGTARAAASVTVVRAGGGTGAPPTISIKSITTGSLLTPVNTQNVFGQIDVTLNVDVPAGSQVTRVETLIDGNVVCTQAFSSAAAIGTASNELGTNAGQVEIVCSIQTQAFNSATGAPTFPNGQHSLTARLVGPTGTIVATPSTTLIFNNTNFVNVTIGSTRTAAGANGPRSLMPAGTQWRGGDLTFTLLPVNYGAATGNVANFTVTITSSGNGVTGAAGCTTTTTSTATNNAATDPTISSTDGGAGAANFPSCGAIAASRTATATTGGPTTITFPASASLTANPAGVANVEDVFSVTAVSSITANGQAGPVCINPTPVVNPQGPGCGLFFPNNNQVPVDNLAPRVTQLNILRPNQYFNGTFVPTHATTGGAGCAAGTPCARTVDYGVDAQVATFQAGPAGSLVDVTAGFSSLPETQTSNTNVFALTIIDALTNSRQVFATTTNTIVANAATNAAVQLFGIDNTAPTQTVAGPPNNSTNCPIAPSNPTTCAGQNGWTISFSDAGVGPSGFNVNPVSVKLERILSTATTCHNPNTGAAISCTTNSGFVADDGVVTIPALDGYYRLTVFVTDAAGNQSTQTVILTLRDYVAPTAGGIASPSQISGGQAAAFSAALSDNVELGDLLPYTTFANSGVSLAEPRMTLGTYGVDAFTATSGGAVSIAKFVKSVETTAGGLPTGSVFPATNFAYAVRDVAGVQLADMCPAVSAADGSTTQNCVLRRVDITAAVATANTFNSFTNLTALNGANALHGLFNQPNPSATTVCTKSSATCTPSPSAPTSTTLSATLTGPAGTFANQFDRVNFYYQDPQGRWIYIGTATVQVTDNTVTSTRTYTYSFVWSPGAQGLLASQFAGGNVAVMAVGVASSGAALLSNSQTITLDDA